MISIPCYRTRKQNTMRDTDVERVAWEIRRYMYACMRVEVVLKHCSGKFRNFYGNVRNECYIEEILFVT